MSSPVEFRLREIERAWRNQRFIDWRDAEWLIRVAREAQTHVLEVREVYFPNYPYPDKLEEALTSTT